MVAFFIDYITFFFRIMYVFLMKYSHFPVRIRVEILIRKLNNCEFNFIAGSSSGSPSAREVPVMWQWNGKS